MKPNLLISASKITGKFCVEKDGEIFLWAGNEEDSIEKPTVEQLALIQQDYDATLAEYEASQYSRDRSTAYPSIAEQLDLLYHDIKSGTLDSGAWIQAIEAVKTEYPKP
jgi:hypothetical protein